MRLICFKRATSKCPWCVFRNLASAHFFTHDACFLVETTKHVEHVLCTLQMIQGTAQKPFGFYHHFGWLLNHEHSLSSILASGEGRHQTRMCLDCFDMWRFHKHETSWIWNVTWNTHFVTIVRCHLNFTRGQPFAKLYFYCCYSSMLLRPWRFQLVSFPLGSISIKKFTTDFGHGSHACRSCQYQRRSFQKS